MAAVNIRRGKREAADRAGGSHVCDWGWHLTSASLINQPLTFSCLLFGTAWPTLLFLVIVCWGLLYFLHHHHIFARISRCLTMRLDATEVPRLWAILRNEYFVLLLCNELVAVKMFHVLQSVVVELCWLPDTYPAALSLPYLNRTGGENKVKKLMGRDKVREITWQSLSWANRLDLEKINLIYC